MKALCVSNDSRMFKVDGKDLPVDRIPGFEERLESAGLPIPGCGGDDLAYSAFDRFRMPATEMFGGRFTEVRNLASAISGAGMAIISGRYGLVGEEDLLLPYRCYVESRQDVELLQQRTGFMESLRQQHAHNDVLLLFLPRAYLEHLLTHWQGSMDRMLVVTSPRLFPELEARGATCLPRRGPRVGSANAEAVRRMVNGGADAGI